MRIGIKLDETVGAIPFAERVAQTRAAAEAGFAAVWTAPHAEWDGLTVLAALGREVPGIRLGTSIVPVYGRHPLVLASQALTIQAVAGDCLELGVGPGASFFIEENFAMPFERPGRYMEEYLSILGPLLRGETVAARGEMVGATGAVVVPGATAPPLLLAALGSTMLRVAGSLADGVMTSGAGPRGLAGYVVPAVTHAAAAAGRPAPRVVAEVVVGVTDDTGGTRTWFDDRFGFIAEMPSYRTMLEREGVRDLWVVGDETAVARELERYAAAGVTDLIACPFGPPEEQERTRALLASLARSARPDTERSD